MVKLFFAILSILLPLNLASSFHHLTELDFKRALTVNDTELVNRYSEIGGPIDQPHLNRSIHYYLKGAKKEIWKNGTIKYRIDESQAKFTSDDKAVIAKAIKHLEAKSCLKYCISINLN